MRQSGLINCNSDRDPVAERRGALLAGESLKCLLTQCPLSKRTVAGWPSMQPQKRFWPLGGFQGNNTAIVARLRSVEVRGLPGAHRRGTWGTQALVVCLAPETRATHRCGDWPRRFAAGTQKHCVETRIALTRPAFLVIVRRFRKNASVRVS